MIEQLAPKAERARPQGGDRRRAARGSCRGEGVISEPIRLKPYETDGLPAFRQLPLAVVLPETTEQVAAVLAFLHKNGVRVVPRGAGTSLSGGALPMADSVVVGLMRMNRILDINYADRCAHGAGGGDQCRHHPGGGRRGLLLRAGPVEPARLHDRRQRRDEFGRRALPEIRGDREQPARAADRDDRGRDHRHRRRAPGCGRL